MFRELSLIISWYLGLTDFGNEYLSVKVTYNPSNNTWELFVRNDGASAFADPLTGSLTSQGTAVDNTNTGTSLPLMGAWWQGNTAANNTAFFDNVTLQVNTTTLNSAGTYTFKVPAGVTCIKVAAWGGGGGGGAVNGQSAEKAAGGGKGGSFVRTNTFTVTPGQTYTVTVGTAGAAGTTSSQDGGDGGTSSFAGNGINIIAAGGNGGNGINSNSNSAAGGQTGSNGTNTFTGVTQDVSASGGDGSGGSTGSNYSGGGGSGAGPISPYNGDPASNQTGGDGDPVGGGDGGNGQSGTGTGSSGSGSGGAGGGARTTNSNDYNGGEGADGQIIISWVDASNFTVSSNSPICSGTNATINLNSTTIADGNYDIKYTTTNPAGGPTTVNNVSFTSGAASFPVSGLTGPSTVEITEIKLPGASCFTSLTGKSTVVTVNANNTAGSPSSTPTLCILTPLSPTITIAQQEQRVYQITEYKVQMACLQECRLHGQQMSLRSAAHRPHQVHLTTASH